MPFIIFLLSILSISLFISLFLLKREIRSIKKQIHDYENGVEKPIDIVLLDKDLTELAAEINKNQSLLKEDKLSIIRREHHLKETISNISHDLRTPLTSLIGYLQLLHKTNLTGEQEEYLNISVSRGKYLQTLINDFYDISVLENTDNVPNFIKINLNNILTEIVLSFTEQFEQKNIIPTINYPNAPTYVLADEIMLKRIITNLISNVIRYGTKELKITISNNHFIDVKFQNLISSTTKIDINKLFEKFYTVDISRNQSGSGLGLYIVKLLTEKMNGKVSANFNDNELVISLLLVKY